MIVAQLILRTASAAGALLVGNYFIDLSRQGVPVGPALLGTLSGLSYLAELMIAPMAGAASDRRGRRVFLVLAPLLAAVGVAVTPAASIITVAPPLLLVVAVIAAARLIDGTGSAMSTPATLALLADATDEDRTGRGRLTGMYELSTSGGIALGAVIGPLLYAIAGLWAFALLGVLYLVAALVIVRFVRQSAPADGRPAPRPLRRRAAVVREPRLLAFLPAWIAVNAILGTWVTAQLTFVLVGDRQVAGQRFPGVFAGHASRLSATLGAYVLIFSACIVVWAFLIGRFPTLPTMLVTVSGTIVASVGLMLANHGPPLAAAAPVVLVGVFLEAGFTPAALTHLADVSAVFRADRGLVMGVYSVVLGLGYLSGNLLGGLFAGWLAFDGLALLTILLGGIALASVLVMTHVERRVRTDDPFQPVRPGGPPA